METTAYHRVAARKAEEKNNWAEAAYHYKLALELYPPCHPDNQMANADKKYLKNSFDNCIYMAEKSW